jgi:GNAT superfamily N-acetyltransferase
MAATFTIRTTTSDDASAVTHLLEASYPPLFALGYAPEVLAKALPMMTKANPRLLASGTFHVAQIQSGEIIGCGGWTEEQPGSDTRHDGVGHVRHFATHPTWIRHGIGRAILELCESQAKAAGLTRIMCYSSLVAVEFYRAMGFSVLGPMDLKLGKDISIPGILMRRDLA